VARILRKLALAACALLSLASTAHAGINTWTGVGPEGGDVSDLVVTQTTPAVAYALTPRALYRSNDVGRTWSQVGARFEQAVRLSVHPTQANRLFIFADGNLLSSSDGGATLVRITPPTPSVRGVEFSTDGSFLYATDGNVFYRSNDFATTWRTGAALPAAQTDDTLIGYYIDPANASRLIVRLYRSGLFITNDAGDHWTAIASPPATVVDTLAFSHSGPRIWAATPDGLWYTNNEGANWTLSAPFRTVLELVVHPSDPSIVYAQAGDTIYRTTDGGANWTNSNGLYGLWYVTGFAFDPQTPDRLLIGSYNGVWSSADGGANWSSTNSGLLATTTSRFTSTTNRTYFVARSEIYYLEPTANSAQRLDPTSLSQVLTPYPQRFIYALHADRVPTGDRLFVSDSDGLMRSLDSGRSWTRIADPLWNRVGAIEVDVAPDNPNIVIAGSSNGVLQSSDGGDRWSTTTGIPANAPIGIVATATGGVAYAAADGRLYKTTDSGLSWAPLNLTGTFFSVLTQGQTLYVSTSNSAYRSVDGGASWSQLFPGGRFAADETGVYFTGRDGVSRSVDGGISWNSVGSFTAFDSTGVQLDPGVRGRVLLTTWYGGVHTYTVATDLAVTASGQPGAAPASGVRNEVSFTVTNRGEHDATGVRLNLNVADGRSWIANSDCSVNTATPSDASCTIAVLPRGQSKVVRIQSSFETAGPLNVAASVTGNETELAATDNSISSSWTYLESVPSSGGGGTFSWWMLLALAGFAIEAKRVHR